MTVPEKMKDYRRKHGYSIETMSRKSGVSTTLLKMVENGLVTHPNIAKTIAMIYELDEGDAYELMPAIHRPDNPEFDPDRYKERADGEGWKKIHISPIKIDIAEIYAVEHANKLKRERIKKGGHR